MPQDSASYDWWCFLHRRVVWSQHGLSWARSALNCIGGFFAAWPAWHMAYFMDRWLWCRVARGWMHRRLYQTLCSAQSQWTQTCCSICCAAFQRIVEAQRQQAVKERCKKWMIQLNCIHCILFSTIVENKKQCPKKVGENREKWRKTHENQMEAHEGKVIHRVWRTHRPFSVPFVRRPCRGRAICVCPLCTFRFFLHRFFSYFASFSIFF